MEEDRYGKDYFYGKVKFRLEDFMPDDEQCKLIMLKVLEQAVRDFCSTPSTIPEKTSWEIAKSFIFNDDHYIDWGEEVINLQEMMAILDIEIDWIRRQTMKRKNNNGKA